MKLLSALSLLIGFSCHAFAEGRCPNPDQYRWFANSAAVTPLAYGGSLVRYELRTMVCIEHVAVIEKSSTYLYNCPPGMDEEQFLYGLPKGCALVKF